MSTLHTTVAAGAISRNPATGQLIATYAFQTPDEVERLLDENAAAFRLWRATLMDERIAAYRRLSATLRERSEAGSTCAVVAHVKKTECFQTRRDPYTVVQILEIMSGPTTSSRSTHAFFPEPSFTKIGTIEDEDPPPRGRITQSTSCQEMPI